MSETDEYISKVVAQAPPLTPEQRDLLAELLRPTRRLDDAVPSGQ
jgi:hypothetical protein